MNPLAQYGGIAKLVGVAALALILVGTHWYAYHAGNRNGTNAEKVANQTAEISRKDTAIATLQSTIKGNEAKAKQDAADAKEEGKNHEKELAAVRAERDAALRRRVPIDSAKFCPSHAAGAAEAPASGNDGQDDTGAAFLPEPFASDLRQLAADADEVTADLRTLKARIEKAGCFQ